MIDRRWIYLVLFVVTLAPLVFRWRLPLYVGQDARNLYASIEQLPTNRLVVLSTVWEAGTLAESRPQTRALMRHPLRRRIPLAIVSIGYQTTVQLAQDAAEWAVAREGHGTYGVDWINLGFKIGSGPFVQAMAQNIPGLLEVDWRGRPLSQFPIMRGVTSFRDVSMLIDVTGSDTVEEYWIPFVHKPYGVPIGYAPTAVMAPMAYPYLDAGQLVGMITGMRGAAEYEQLLGYQDVGSWAMAGQSFAHAFILVLIVVGNVATFRRPAPDVRRQ
jgi:hypothetical protein